MTSGSQAAVKYHNGENNQFRVVNFAALTCFTPSFSVISMIIIVAEDNTDPSGVRQQLKGTLFTNGGQKHVMHYLSLSYTFNHHFK